jgi:hypothetical protein
MSKSIYHYTYIIKNTTNNIQYIGVRSCNCLPENDSGYMGSSKILNEAMNKTTETFTKIIIDTFPTRKIANSNEQWLHETYDVARNPEFYNQMNAPVGFYNDGSPHTDEARSKMSENHVGMYGRKHTPETRKKMSIAHKKKLRGPRGPRGPQKKLTCPHCSKIGGGSAMQRWHFTNCREIS